MPKKIEEAEVKKECPSCGLGVALDATICEFCGWDFQEEDEWILQIEKLERDLMLEKQKFEPGTVDQMIESTLHAPLLEGPEMAKAPPEAKPPTSAERTPAPEPLHARPSAAPSSLPRVTAAAPQVESEKSKVRRVRVVKGAPAAEVGLGETPRVRRIRTMKNSRMAERPREPGEKRSRRVLGGLFFSKEQETEPETAQRARKVKK